MDIPNEITWLGEFKGQKLTFLEAEILALQKLDRVTMKALWEARRTCWFDYARLHPVQSLNYFAAKYSKYYGGYLYQNINMDLRYSLGLKGNVMDSREVRQFAQLMMEADKRGVPYDEWLTHLFAFFAKEGWTRPPRPAQILARQDAIEYADQRWLEKALAVGMYAQDPWYDTQAWVGHPIQRLYEDWLVYVVNLREQKSYSLAHLLYVANQLRIERVLLEFKARDIRDAQRWVTAFPEPSR